MLVVKTVDETDNFLAAKRKRGLSAGLVPTMGALHEGHLSLVRCCKKENDIAIVSVFVNPTQFNDPGDLENYPRNLEKDLEMLGRTGCDMVFAPDKKTVYPEPDLRTFDFGHLGNTMEGLHRPGHFNGVAQVVSRLFEIIKPDRAYFGEKDIQQLAIIRKLTAMLDMPVEIRSCPTLRETDGLAMSSRNALLNAEQRNSAALISRTLSGLTEKKELEIGELKKWVAHTINSNPYLELEYFEVIDSGTFRPVGDTGHCNPGMAACIAVRAGNVRLIDNVFFPKFV